MIHRSSAKNSIKSLHRWRPFSLLLSSELASLTIFSWQNQTSKSIHNNGDIVNKAKRDVFIERVREGVSLWHLSNYREADLKYYINFKKTFFCLRRKRKKCIPPQPNLNLHETWERRKKGGGGEERDVKCFTIIRNY